ncbi:MAG: chloride channel protein [Gammaproteobacteria bacterium]|nr:chloride channel protein [Gammaproteobacteria bacterium]
MKTNSNPGGWPARLLERLRLLLARPDALVPLALLGLLSGLCAGGVIIGFRYLVESSQTRLLPGGFGENYEALQFSLRAALPIGAGIGLAIMFRLVARSDTMLGVAGVMNRMAYHQGRITVRGFALQFVGAALAIIGGHSVGREGPNVYLGSAAGSLLGQYLGAPNNAIRTLAACGTAAGIAASFNTPLAGVIFALEVVMMEYTVASFVPVILAAVGATTLSNLVFGTAPAFAMPALQIHSMAELGLVIGLAVGCGAIAAIFNRAIQAVAVLTKRLAIWWRMPIAGCIAGIIGVFVPQVMGIGYDTVSLALVGDLALTLTAVLVVAKLLATAVAVGCGVPGGMIGPALFIGAMAGATVSGALAAGNIGTATDAGFYALLGMGAMMSASLHAPLAALTAMLELTDNPAVILPGMLAVVVSRLAASELFGGQSLFISTLKAAGMDYDASPVLQALRRIGVAGVMNTQFVRVDRKLTGEQAHAALVGEPAWLLVDENDAPAFMLRAVDLARQLETEPPAADASVDLKEIPARRYAVAPVHLDETLQQAIARIERGEGEALYVQRIAVPGINRIYGVLTREAIEGAYRK